MRGFGTCYRQPGSRFWWIQYWQDGKRHRESSGSEKLKAAQNILLHKLAEIEDAADGTNYRFLLIRHLYEALERDYVIHGRKSLRNIKTEWENHLSKPFAERIAAQLDSDDIGAYVTRRLSEGAKNATVNRELAALKRMYKLAKVSGKLKADCPYIPQLTERNVRKGFVKDAQYEALAKETAAIGLWLRAMFEVGYTYGWRKTELLKMKVGQLDLMERTIDLNPGETKNDEGRVVEMTRQVYELLRQCAAGKGAEDYVFTRDRELNGRKPKLTGGRIVDFRKAWEKATEAAGCPGLLFHDLRRSGVRNMRRNGTSETVAMRISGHKTASVFRRYNIVDPTDLREATAKMERASRERQQRDLFEQVEMFGSSEKKPAGSSGPGVVAKEVAASRRPN